MEVKVTGNQIMRRRKRLEQRAERTLKLFEEALSYRESKKPELSPENVLVKYELIESYIAFLGFLQAKYNTEVMVQVDKDQYTLEELVKMKGTISTLAKKWKEAVDLDIEALNRYEAMNWRHSEDKPEPLVATLDRATAEKLYEAASDRLDSFSDAIARGNAKELTMSVPEGVMSD